MKCSPGRCICCCNWTLCWSWPSTFWKLASTETHGFSW